MGRAPCCDKANVKRGPWSPEEDAALRSYIEKHGTGGNWIALPQKAGLKRCGKSCRLRWLNYLRPDIKHGGFTEEEDNMICALYNKIGSRWSVIASHLDGRTDNDVKNYWNTKLKKKVMAAAGQTSLPNTTTTSPSSSTAHIYHSPSPTPPPNPPFLAAIKSEAYICGNFSSVPDTSFGFSHDSGQKLYSELPQFPAMGLVKQPDYSTHMTVSPAEDISAASSTITVDNNNNNSSSSNSYLNWSAGDDGLLSDLGFGSFSEFLSGCGSNEKMGDMAPYYLSNMWATSDAKPQGLYQSVTYS